MYRCLSTYNCTRQLADADYVSLRRHTVLGSVHTELIITIPDTPPRAGQSVLSAFDFDILHLELISGGTTRRILPSWPGSLLLPWLAMEEDSGVRQVRGCQIILTHKGRSTHYKVGLGRGEISLLNLCCLIF